MGFGVVSVEYYSQFYFHSEIFNYAFKYKTEDINLHVFFLPQTERPTPLYYFLFYSREISLVICSTSESSCINYLLLKIPAF